VLRPPPSTPLASATPPAARPASPQALALLEALGVGGAGDGVGGAGDGVGGAGDGVGGAGDGVGGAGDGVGGAGDGALGAGDGALGAGDGLAPGLRSPAMRQALALLAAVAPTHMAVLLEGETGSGREALARALHAWSPRAAGPFVPVDCSTLAAPLLEAELLGHVAGPEGVATPGLLVHADGGTLFLDGLEALPAPLQLALLRVLETGEVRPAGAPDALRVGPWPQAVRRVDVRVVAASRRPLEAEVREGRFRADLYYRLSAFPVRVPPLRERPEDVAPLAAHFLARSNAALGRSAAGLGAPALALLEAHPWPGNVRELRNVVERAVLLSRPGEWLHPGHLPPHLVARADALGAEGPAGAPGAAAGVAAGAAGAGRSGGTTPALRERLAQVERELIRQALAESGGVLRRAAEAVGMDAVTFGRRVRKYGLGP
jgi:DNA-binding NtrC family response regulator